MNEDLEQRRGEASGPPAVPEWFTAPVPGAIHHAAFAAWVHRPTGSVLLRFWHGCACSGCQRVGCGHWTYEVRHPSGRGQVVGKSMGSALPPELDLLEPAEIAIAGIEEELQQGG